MTCTAAGSKTLTGFNGVLECPDPATFCARSNPVYCERGCSGRGTCGADGKCVCPTGWAGADCALRTYVIFPAIISAKWLIRLIHAQDALRKLLIKLALAINAHVIQLLESVQ